jgi:hypothetical protein
MFWLFAIAVVIFDLAGKPKLTPAIPKRCLALRSRTERTARLQEQGR